MRSLLGPGSWGAVVPHAPLLVDGIGHTRTHPDLLHALQAVRELGAEAVVVISPHGSLFGVYARARGSLERFSIAGMEIERPTDDDLTRGLAASCERAPRNEPADHGIVVPLLLDAVPKAALACCGLRESTGPGHRFTDADRGAAALLAQAISTVAEGRDIAVIASAHTSAALAPQAPLTGRAGARALDDRLLASIERDIADILTIEREGWEAGDPCGRGPLLVLAHLFGGRPGSIHAYDDGEGVGYLVATVGPA